MQRASTDMVTKVRSASRALVREFGFMGKTVAGTDLPPSAVHAIVEIGAAGRLSAKDLSAKLLLEKSTVSRLVKSLVERGELREARAADDGRSKHLHLTHRGAATLDAITAFAERQVGSALAPLPDRCRQQVLTGLETYTAALKASRTCGDPALGRPQATIEDGYVPGLIGRMVEMHAHYYNARVGFGASFETETAGDMVDLVERLESPVNEIWTARLDGHIVGSIAIDGDGLGDGRALLRFFLVSDDCRGTGLGKALIERAMAFCDAHGFRETHLWTFRGLDAALGLYDAHGFTIAEEHVDETWGSKIQKLRLVRPKGG
ncbi:MAG: helix-turn-helix domain-containing GNAT family N-acetyltransferase [Hyphomicrobiales bacterium]|nr:helix-turn-helix domain-containing GNAT family N-acetyltransferase [Hyphomicrobiales bacterium]